MTSQGSAGAVDFAYLEGFAAGDRQVVGEVLALFRMQAGLWIAKLDAADPGWRDLAHTIKGAARGIGAHALGEVCATAEAEGPQHLPAVRAALDEALADIAAYQARQGRRPPSTRRAIALRAELPEGSAGRWRWTVSSRRRSRPGKERCGSG